MKKIKEKLPMVSVILLNWNGLEYVKGCLPTLMKQDMEFHGEKNRIMNLLLFYETKTLLKMVPLLVMNILFNLLISIPKLRTHIRLKSYFWIISNLGKIMRKRKEFQSTRKISDKEIFKYFAARIPYKLWGFEKIANMLLSIYCFAFRIPVGA